MSGTSSNSLLQNDLCVYVLKIFVYRNRFVLKIAEVSLLENLPYSLYYTKCPLAYVG